MAGRIREAIAYCAPVALALLLAGLLSLLARQKDDAPGDAGVSASKDRAPATATHDGGRPSADGAGTTLAR